MVSKRLVLPQSIHTIHLDADFADLTVVKEFTESAAQASLTASPIKMIQCQIPAISLCRVNLPQWKLHILEDCDYVEQQENVDHRYSDIRDALASS